MSSHTEENLDKLLKKDLIPIILAIQSKLSADNAEVDNVRYSKRECLEGFGIPKEVGQEDLEVRRCLFLKRSFV